MFPGVSSVWIVASPFLVIVDYAHTDDALRNLLATAKELGRGGRIITLFLVAEAIAIAPKTPHDGRAAGRASDFVCSRADNPRSEIRSSS